ncbi:MAG TPA: hypothetical protein VHV57_07560 [Acidimicrobiales bacterium]|nr:hypothetical protein [Acidimicrobiales bacterium]
MKRTRLVGLTLVVLLLTSCSATVVHHGQADPSTNLPRGSVTTTPSRVGPLTTTTTTQPSATQTDDLTWVSPTRGWALTSTCPSAACTAVLSTTDGGSIWTPIGSIAASAGACDTGCDPNGPQVTHIRFANDLDGYAYDPNLFVTTDGGVSWHQVPGPMVAALEPAGSDVIRISYTQTGCPGPCDLTVQEASAGSAAWRLLKAPFQADSVQLVRQGVDDIYVAGFANPAGGADDAHATLWLSANGGASWTERADPCVQVGQDEYDLAALAAAPSSVVTGLCVDRGGQHSYVAVSTDGGAEFTGEQIMPGSDFFRSIAVTNASAIFLSGYTTGPNATSRFLLWASQDGGQDWKQVASESGSPSDQYPLSGFLGFENASVGRWCPGGNALWNTTDGGSSWIVQPLYPT